MSLILLSCSQLPGDILKERFSLPHTEREKGEGAVSGDSSWVAACDLGTNVSG